MIFEGLQAIFYRNDPNEPWTFFACWPWGKVLPVRLNQRAEYIGILNGTLYRREKYGKQFHIVN